jgi:argininosuccinate lyase
LWVAKAATALDHMAAGLQLALVGAARRSIDVVMPGYTHLQRAQPIRAGHHLMAYVEMLRRDRERLQGARERCLQECPLGSGALAATPFPINREMVAEELGFDAPSANSIDAVGSRDFALEFLAAAAICAVHLSRFGEELVNWSSAEFAFVDLPDAFCTSSSIMPQKKNPDIAELVRAKSGRVCGALQTLLMVVKGLPLAYDKDLQEDKEPVFDAADTLALCLRAMAGLVEGLVFNKAACAEAAAGGYTTATDVADWLVERGVPFREAHGVVGRMVKDASVKGIPLSEIPDAQLTSYHSMLDPTVRQCLDPETSVDRRSVVGGPARERVLEAIERWEDRLT